MTEGKLPVGQIIALATVGVVGSMALVGLINTARWMLALPPEAELSTLPLNAWWDIGKLALQFVVGLGAFVGILFGSPRVAARAAVAGIAMLLLLHVASWILDTAAPEAVGFVAKHGVRVGFGLWLLVVLGLLAPGAWSRRATVG